MKLSELKVGESGIIESVGGEGIHRQHFLDMGVIPGAAITLKKLAPMGDPMEFTIYGYELTLRVDDASKIEIKPATVREIEDKFNKDKETHDISYLPGMKTAFHPGLGEEGKYHDHKNENPLPEDALLTFALVGNQNCGKTTLFNQLTGSNQHVGNFPGVTVDRKDGPIKGRYQHLLLICPVSIP